MLGTDKIEIVTYNGEYVTLIENCLAAFGRAVEPEEELDTTTYCTELNEIQADFLAELVDYENSDVEFIYPDK